MVLPEAKVEMEPCLLLEHRKAALNNTVLHLIIGKRPRSDNNTVL